MDPKAVLRLSRRGTEADRRPGWVTEWEMGDGETELAAWWTRQLGLLPAASWKVMDGKPQCEKAICCLLFV